MIKPLIPENEAERLDALMEYNILDSLPEEEYDNITLIASEICQMPVALITIMSSERQWFKSHHGTGLKENTRNLTFCAHGMLHPDQPMVVNNALEDVRFRENPLITGKANIRFYAGITLVDKDGFALGSLCVFDVKANEITESQLATLKALAQQVVKLLELRKNVYQLEKTHENLIRANKHLAEFDYIISHDIKAPLRNMKHLAEALQEDFGEILDSNGQEYVQLINETANDAISFVDGVLAYSKAMHYTDNKKEEINLNKLLATIIREAEPPEHIVVSITEILPTIHTSNIALRQIFCNLLSNAIKYNDKVDGWVKINYISTEDKHTFQIADNGQGIPAEKLESIFALFYMVDKEDARRKGSSGIGLSIVKKIVEEMGGAVKVSSLLGNGSIFEFYIPK